MMDEFAECDTCPKEDFYGDDDFAAGIDRAAESTDRVAESIAESIAKIGRVADSNRAATALAADLEDLEKLAASFAPSMRRASGE